MARLEVGSVWWEVCWTADVPVNEFGDPDVDAGKEKRRLFRSEVDAKRFAESIYSEDYFGCVAVSQFEVGYLVPEDCAGRTEDPIGQPQYYTGPEGGWD